MVRTTESFGVIYPNFRTGATPTQGSDSDDGPIMMRKEIKKNIIRSKNKKEM